MQCSWVNGFLAEEEGAEVTELALVFALIVALAVVTISSLGGSVSNTYVTVDNALP
jgi:Flp pilus assembly pilin Flp